MITEDIYIYPIVRRLVSQLSKLTRTIIISSTIAALIELLLLMCGELSIALFFGSLSTVLYILQLTLSTWLIGWCSKVLLPGRLISTTILGITATVMSLFMPVCELYTSVTHELLLIKQTEIPFFVWGIVAILLLDSCGTLRTLPAKWWGLICGFWVLQLIILLTNTPELLLICLAIRLLLTFTAIPLLRKLANIAHRVVSMPPPGNPGTPHQEKK